jgi:rSAM/selenodomain-associated transferase 1
MSDTKPKQSLLVFVKNPLSGKVKTRLGKSIGYPQAAQVYRKLLAHTKQQILRLKADVQIWYGDAINNQDLWSQTGFSKHLQIQEDLGQRMNNAVEKAFAEGAHKVVVIGSDCPEISTQVLQQAFEELKKHDVVIGPANDGGYYLLGFSKYYNLFNNIAWSTSTVLPQTLAQIKTSQLSHFLLPELVDLDTVEDLKKFPEYDT